MFFLLPPNSKVLDGDVSEKEMMDFGISEGLFHESFRKNIVSLCGEAPQYNPSKSGDYLGFDNFCPEVALFEKGCVPSWAARKPITTGYWNDIDGVRTAQERHYTECPEFAAYSNAIAKPNKNADRNVRPKDRFSTLDRDEFICQYCGRGRKHGVILHVDHKISKHDGGTDDISNLITSCEECNLGKGKKSVIL